MFFLLLEIIILLFSVEHSQALSCNSCNGPIDVLTNSTCSTQVQNDTCYIEVRFDGTGFLVIINAFKETNNSEEFPYNYKKPKSGSDFAEYNFVTSDVQNNLIGFRYFCYTDKCNRLDLAQRALKAQIQYMKVEFSEPLTECLTCQGPNYDSVKNCNATQSCKYVCSLDSSIVNNDLYDIWNWDSSCSVRSTGLYGLFFFQYEMQTKILNMYVNVACPYKECSSFDFMNTFMKSVELSF